MRRARKEVAGAPPRGWHARFRDAVRSILGRILRAAAPRGDRIDNAALLAETAARLTGLDRPSLRIETSRIRRRPRVLLRLHTIYARRSGLDSPVLRLVEKRTREAMEFRFYTALLPLQDAFPRLAPLVLGSSDQGFRSRDPRRYTLLLEHVERQGIPDTSPTTARRLGESFAAVAMLDLPGLRLPQTFNQLSGHLLDRFSAAARSSGFDGSPEGAAALRLLADGWMRLSTHRFALPLVPTHNDLHERNICRIADGRGGEHFVFLDWEMLALNHAGADLHAVLRQAVIEPGLSAFYAAVRRAYVDAIASRLRIDETTADLGAHLYALRRTMRRAIRTQDVFEIEVATRIHEALRRLV